jgi:hypothetical protein
MSSGFWKVRNWALWRGQPPSEMDEEPTCIFSIRRARNVGAPSTWDGLAPLLVREKCLGDGIAPGSTDALTGSRSGRVALRRERW